MINDKGVNDCGEILSFQIDVAAGAINRWVKAALPIASICPSVAIIILELPSPRPAISVKVALHQKTNTGIFRVTQYEKQTTLSCQSSASDSFIPSSC